MRKVLLTIIILFAFLIGARSVRASEGTVELTSTKGEAMRCFATSVLMEDFNYKVIVSCRDLIYPPKPDVFNYMLWANLTDGDRAEPLGELGVGKAEFKTKSTFRALFVTLEKSGRPRTPEGEKVMEGNIQSVDFLEKGTQNVLREPVAEPTMVEVTPTPTPKPSARNIVTKILGTGLILIAVVIAIIFVVYLITRRR